MKLKLVNEVRRFQNLHSTRSVHPLSSIPSSLLFLHTTLLRCWDLEAGLARSGEEAGTRLERRPARSLETAHEPGAWKGLEVGTLDRVAEERWRPRHQVGPRPSCLRR